MTSNQTKHSLKQHNLAPHKRFGQNFLVNPHTARSIVNCGKFDKTDTILEVGVGLGALTEPLSEVAGHVIGIEIDRGLIRYHREEKKLPGNVTLIEGDILQTDLAEIHKKCGCLLKIMANLPYSISNPFIFTLIEYRQHIDWVVVMLQKEVAERLTAKPSSKQYGIPTVLLSAYAGVEKLFVIKPHEFHPQPKIDSMVIKIDFNRGNEEIRSLPSFSHSLFQKIVRASFAQRRKTLLNNLSTLIFTQVTSVKKEARKLADKIIYDSNLSPQLRAEDLTLSHFISLTLSADFLLNVNEQS